MNISTRGLGRHGHCEDMAVTSQAEVWRGCDVILVYSNYIFQSWSKWLTNIQVKFNLINTIVIIPLLLKQNIFNVEKGLALKVLPSVDHMT